MHRFYFHLDNRIGLLRDEEGQELADLSAAKASAVSNIRSILKSDIDEGLIDLRGKIEIADERGTVLEVVRFAEAVELRQFGGIQ